MNKRLLWVVVGLVLLAGSLTACTWRPTSRGGTAVHVQTSVCTMTGLTGPARTENDMYCANGRNIAPSTYPEAIALAATKAIIVGTPTQVSTCHDFHGVLRVCVEFTRGYQAEHYLAYNPAYHPVWIYDPFGKQVWP
jgi:hypothetical protein